MEINHTYSDTIERVLTQVLVVRLNNTPETLKSFSMAHKFPYEELMRITGYPEDYKVAVPIGLHFL